MHQLIDSRALVRRLLDDGLTTKVLSEKVGLSQPSISRLATGRTLSTSSEVFQLLVQLAGGAVTLPPVTRQKQTSTAAEGRHCVTANPALPA